MKDIPLSGFLLSSPVANVMEPSFLSSLPILFFLIFTNTPFGGKLYIIKKWWGMVMSKLIKCKSCGASIAKNAKACPNCGAKQHQGVYTICGLIAVFAVFLVGFIIFNGTGNEKSKYTSSTQTISVSATDLWQAYADNKVNADGLYKDKWVCVTGTITDISQDLITKKPCVNLSVGDDYGLYPIQCFFTNAEEQTDRIAALRDGQTVTIVGECKGTPVINIQLTDCHLQ